MPVPNGAWIFVLSQLEPDYIAKLKRANCKRVYLKTLDDYPRITPNYFWTKNCAPENLKPFIEAGIEVWGWGYVFDQKKVTNIELICEAIQKTFQAGCSGFVFDIEHEVEDTSTHAQVAQLLERARPLIPPGRMGYTSFGNPALHPNVPWQTLHAKCDLQFPQIYYEKWSGDIQIRKQKVDAAIAAHRAIHIDGKPILPLWCSEADTQVAWRTKVPELQSYLDSYPGSSVWRLPDAGVAGIAFEVDYGSNSSRLRSSR